MTKHFTVTAYIVAQFEGEYKILLHRHKKHRLWIGIGGHIEEGENPVQALMREVKEETNLEIKLLNKNRLINTQDVEELVRPDIILEEKMPDYRSELAHYHIDLIYFAICKKPQYIKMNEQYAWVAKNSLKKMKLNKEVHYLAQKFFKLLEGI
ncbi:NUDIX domain-containing protein [Candidatus Microgenomates bacterium]|nr:NUDIX domain-containing protein [Candidatus Microgenomates bacterium]